MLTSIEKELFELLAPVQQTHLLRFWNKLPAAQQENLAGQIRDVNWDKTVAWAEAALQEENLPIPFDQLKPAPYTALQATSDTDKAAMEECRHLGLQLLQTGQLAGFTVAGGQGTRLGYDAPKGTFQFTPMRKASLFQFFAESLLRYQERYQCCLPWYIMTSPANDQPTREFFAEHQHFGLAPDDVHFFSQGTLPAFDLQGKAILATPGSLALSANGHGGSFAALKDSGALDDMLKRGISILSYWQVDNPMVKLFDPVFIGRHQQSGSEMSSRALIKRNPLEKLGHFCHLANQTLVVEYSDMPEKLLYQSDAKGQLLYRAGSPAIHLLNCEFIQRLTNGTLNLQPHRALKKVPFIDQNGQQQTPEQPNAIKLEFFLFDALPLAKNPLIFEADRNEQFAPIKNACGTDSPESCRAALLARTAHWFDLDGKPFPRKSDGSPDAEVEISPRRIVDAEDFLEQAAILPPVTPGSSLLLS
ncbi:MAG: UDPGP type 1 family protein [Lentisphaeria bacterium]